MLNVITASALLFGASAMASYEVVYTSGHATTTVYCTEGEKPTTPAGYYVHATHTKPVYHSAATPVYHTKPVYYSSAAPVYSAPAKPYSAPVKPYTTSCTEETYGAGYTAPVMPYSAAHTAPVYSAPVYSAPVYSAPSKPVYSTSCTEETYGSGYTHPAGYSAPVYSAPSNGSYYSAPAPVYSAPVYTTAVVTVCPGVNYCYATTTSYCPESTAAVYTHPAPVYSAPVYTAPAVVYTHPAPVYTAPAAPVYTAPAPVYTAPAAPYTPVSNSSSVPTPYAYTGSASGLQVSGAMVAIAAVAALMIGA